MEDGMMDDLAGLDQDLGDLGMLDTPEPPPSGAIEANNEIPMGGVDSGGAGGGNGNGLGGGGSLTRGAQRNLDLLMDVPLNVSVRLGQVRMQVRDLLKLNKGSLIELEKEADDPLEIYVNDRLLAFGEVVMIKDKLGIRITDIVSLAERLENLR